MTYVQPHQWKALAETFIYLPEHKSILKNNQNTYYLRFIFFQVLKFKVQVQGVLQVLRFQVCLRIQNALLNNDK